MKQLVACLLLASAAFAAEDSPKLRLGTDVRPIDYAADLTLSPSDPAFTGRIDIRIDLAKPASIVWLNAVDIEIAKASSGAQSAQIVKGEPGFVGLRFATALPAGRASLHIEYSGKVEEQSTAGVFLGKDGGNRYLFTQFEEIDARRAFPCFDQPEFKTPWKLTLHVPKDQLAFANTPQVGAAADESGGRKRYDFAPTKPLPSYLVAFAVGPFEVVEAGRAGKAKFPVRIITLKGKANQAKYAAEVTAGILDRLEAYFGVPYGYEKSDSISIPLTYGFDAMENAGLVTYAENTLLSDPATDSISRQRRYASEGAHELGHQWFGDLVTPVWWDDIWLNESFATWISAKMLAEWHPEWHTRLNDLSSAFGAMQEDGLASARQIRQPINNESDISSAFDGITYEKGAAVIRMFESWVGEKQFQAGIQGYMRRYAYKSAKLGDFLDAISNGSQPRLPKAFTTFLDQPGFPAITAELKCDGSPRLALSQKRYKPAGSAAADEVWQTPVCVRYSTPAGPKSECFLLDQTQAEFKLKTSSCPTYLSANDNSAGYYATSYSDAMLDQFLKPGAPFLNAAEKVTLLHDLGSLTTAGTVKPSRALEAAAVFANAPERQIAARAATVVGGFRLLVPANLRPNFARFVQKTFGARAARLGWTPKPSDDDETKLERASLVPFVARYGDSPDLRAQARSMADEWLKSKQGIDPNLLAGVLTTAAYYGDRALFDSMVATLANTHNLQQRNPILQALSSFRDPAVIEAGMQLVLAGKIDPRESFGLLFSGSGDPATERLPFEFVKTHYDELLKLLPSGGGSDAGAVLPYVGGGFCDAKSRQELSDFFKDRAPKFNGGQHNFDEVMESTRLCAAQRELNGPDVAAFFAKQ